MYVCPGLSFCDQWLPALAFASRWSKILPFWTVSMISGRAEGREGCVGGLRFFFDLLSLLVRLGSEGLRVNLGEVWCSWFREPLRACTVVPPDLMTGVPGMLPKEGYRPVRTLGGVVARFSSDTVPRIPLFWPVTGGLLLEEFDLCTCRQ